VVNDIRGIGPDAADHGRRHARLKSQAEKRQTGRVHGDAAFVARIAVRAENRKVDSAIIRRETRTPDDDRRVDDDAVAIGRPSRTSVTDRPASFRKDLADGPDHDVRPVKLDVV
jgi:hypothetical protein